MWKDLKTVLTGTGLSILALTLWTGCGAFSPTSLKSPTSSIAASLSGVVSAAPVSGATVTAYTLNTDGSQGASLGSTTTDANGNYTLGFTTAVGPVLLVATSGNYSEEAGSSTVSVGQAQTRTVLPTIASGSQKVAITPVTEIAAQSAIAAITANPSANVSAVIDSTNKSVASSMGLSNIIEPPVSPTAPSASASTNAKQYAIVLGTISQMAKTASTATATVNSLDITQSLAISFAYNGNFNSTVTSSGLPLDIPVPNSAGTALTLNQVFGTLPFSTAMASSLTTYTATAQGTALAATVTATPTFSTVPTATATVTVTPPAAPAVLPSAQPTVSGPAPVVGALPPSGTYVGSSFLCGKTPAPGMGATTIVNGNTGTTVFQYADGCIKSLNQTYAAQSGGLYKAVDAITACSSSCPSTECSPHTSSSVDWTAVASGNAITVTSSNSVDSSYNCAATLSFTLSYSTASTTPVSAPVQTTWSAGTDLSSVAYPWIGGGGPGGSNYVRRLAIDPVHGYNYAVEGYRIARYSRSTGAFAGAIGLLNGSVGSCPPTGKAPGWCSGGNFASGMVDGAVGASSGRIYGLAIDPVNNALYFLDGQNSRVEKFNLATGAFIGAIGDVQSASSSGTCPSSGPAPRWCTAGTFMIGTVDGAFQYPQAITVDSSGFIYVVDSSNFRVTKINGSTGAVVGSIGNLSSTLSGGTCPVSGATLGWCRGGVFASGLAGRGGFFGADDIALDPTAGFLYIVDNLSVSKFNLSTGAFVGAIGGLSASTGTCPATGVATAWCTGGTFVTGSSDGSFSYATGIALDTVRGVFFISEFNNHRVNKFSLANGAFIGAIGALTSSTGTCPASGPAHGWCTGGVFKMVYGTSPQTLPLNQFSWLGNQGMVVDGNSLNIVDEAKILTVNSDSGAPTGYLTFPHAGGWVSSTSIFGSAAGFGDGSFGQPTGVAVDSAGGNVYVVDSYKVQKFDLTTGTFIGAIGNLIGSNGTCSSSGVTTAWCTGGTFGPGTANGAFNAALGIAVDAAAGTLYVVDGSSNSRVEIFNLATGAYQGLLTGSVMSSARGVSVDAVNGFIYVTDQNLLKKFTRSSGAFVSSITLPNSVPSGITIDTANSLFYVADNGQIDKYNLSTGAIIGSIGNISGTATTGWTASGTFTYGTGDGMFAGVGGVVIDTATDFMYASDLQNNRIQKFKLSTGAFIGAIGQMTTSTSTCEVNTVATTWCKGGTSVAGWTGGAFSYPGYMAMDTLGHLYVTDGNNARVVRFMP